jgi:hypothetical protein
MPAKKIKYLPTTRDAILLMIENAEAHFSQENAKVTVSDYIRLLQVHREFSDEPPSELTVRWIGPPAEGD